MSGKVWLSVKEVSQILKVSEKTVYRYISGGKLKARREGKSWVVNANRLSKVSGNEIKTPYKAFSEVGNEPEARNNAGLEDLRKQVEELNRRLDEGKSDKPELWNAILDQLKEKDYQIKELNQRLFENNSLLLQFKNLLPAGREYSPESNSGFAEQETTEPEAVQKPLSGNKPKRISLSLQQIQFILIGVLGTVVVVLYLINAGVIRF